MNLKFAHISDLHFRRNYQDVFGVYHDVLNGMDSPLTQMKTWMKEKTEDLDFVIVTGDLCELGDEEDYRVLKKELEDFFQVPIFSTPGNHDKKKPYCNGFLEMEERDPIVFSSVIQGLRIISLDSASEKDNDGEITEEALNQLKTILEQDNTTESIVITQHHLLQEQFSMRIAKYPKELEEVLKVPCIKAIFNGHTHHPYIGTFADKPYFTAGCFSFVGENGKEGAVEFYQNASYSMVTYDGNRFDYQILREKTPRYLGKIVF